MQRTSSLLVGWIILGAPACLSETGQVGAGTSLAVAPDTSAPSAEVVPADSAAGVEVAGTPEPFVVHEWGTFTSQQSPDGVSQAGLHHEDEPLPWFVYQRDFRGSTYYTETLPEEPLQQLETPVVYFYSDRARDVRFHVGFPEGLVTQWYPRAGDFLPVLGAIAGVRDGAMDWDVRVDPAIDPATFPAVNPEEIWAPARKVGSTPVSVAPASRDAGAASEHEQFIFYRGLGKFDLPVRAVATDNELVIRNESRDTLSDVFVLYVDGKDLGSLRSLGRLGPGESRAVPLPLLVGGAAWLGEAQAAMRAALAATGLYPDEAAAMVATWTRSWFGNHGLRVLYLVPRAWTDRLLPVTITPAPDALVRTLVGRIEVMTPSSVREAYEAVSEGAATVDPVARSQIISALGRFAEPRIRYVLNAPGLELANVPGASELLQMAHDVW